MNRKSLIIFMCEDWKCPPAASTDTVQLSTPGPSPCCPGVCIHSEWDVLVLARTSNRGRTKQAHQLHTVPLNTAELQVIPSLFQTCIKASEL